MARRGQQLGQCRPPRLHHIVSLALLLVKLNQETEKVIFREQAPMAQSKLRRLRNRIQSKEAKKQTRETQPKRGSFSHHMHPSVCERNNPKDKPTELQFLGSGEEPSYKI